MKSILVIEDDEFFRTAITDILKKNGFTIAEAPDGKAAKNLLNLTNYDLIISDIQMPHLNGLEILEWVKEKKQIPVILMTGFSSILETQSAYDLGAKGFLAKPFQESELMDAVNSVIGLSEPTNQTPVEVEELYCKILISDFVMGSQIPFSIFIQLGGNKYLKIAHKGENLPPQKIKIYMERNVRYLYIRLEDYATLVGMNLRLAKSMGGNSSISAQTKRNFIKYTGEIILEKTFVGGMNHETFNAAKEFIENSLTLLSQDDDAFMTLSVLNQHADFLYAHSLGVSAYSVLIAKKLGWTSLQTIFKISVSGLFHDIGKKEIDRVILDKPRSTLTQQERKIIESHTVRGQEILTTIRTMPTDVVRVAVEHHENVLGMGYPSGLKREKIHPIARLINVADVFCNYAIKNPNSDGMSGSEAIQKMKIHDAQNLESEYFNALAGLFG